MSGGAAVQGTVTDGDDDPVEGATVLVVPRSDNATSVGGSAQTTVTGAYIVAGLPVGTYDVIAAAADGTVGSGEISVGAGDATLDLTLAPGEAVTGTVVDADTRAPVAGARITTTATGPGRERKGGDAGKGVQERGETRGRSERKKK